MGKRITVTERVLEDRPAGRGFEALLDETRKVNSRNSRNSRNEKPTENDEKPTKDAAVEPAGQHSGNLVKATFSLDPETLDILNRIWLRQRKRGGQDKSALVRDAIRWFRAKPRNRVEQLLDVANSAVNWAIIKGRGTSRRTIGVIMTLAAIVVGSLFIGGALWLGQGAHRGAGDAMGIGILTSLGATLILLGLGTALISAVTYFADLPLDAEPPEADVKASGSPTGAARPKRTLRKWRLRQQA